MNLLAAHLTLATMTLYGPYGADRVVAFDAGEIASAARDLDAWDHRHVRVAGDSAGRTGVPACLDRVGDRVRVTLFGPPRVFYLERAAARRGELVEAQPKENQP